MDGRSVEQIAHEWELEEWVVEDVLRSWIVHPGIEKAVKQ